MNQPDNFDCDLLAWDAWRYAAGEMTADEVTAFEERLASDQTVREALVTAVELSQVMLAAEQLSTPMPASSLPVHAARHYRLEPLAWFTVGALACLAVMMVSSSYWPSYLAGRNSGPALATRSAISPALVAAWSETALAETPAIEEADLNALPEQDWSGHGNLSGHDGMDIADLISFDDSSPAPGWMLEAIRGPDPASDAETTGDANLES